MNDRPGGMLTNDKGEWKREIEDEEEEENDYDKEQNDKVILLRQPPSPKALRRSGKHYGGQGVGGHARQ